MSAWRSNTRATLQQIGMPGLPATVTGIMPANALKNGRHLRALARL